MKIFVGQHVMLRSGGPCMTVLQLGCPIEETITVFCEWDTDDEDQETDSKHFKITELVDYLTEEALEA